MSHWLRKVKDLQALLWSERGTCRGDEVADAFNLWEAAFFRAKALEHTSCVEEKLWIGFAVYEYIVDVYSTDVVDEAVENLVLHARERK